MKHMLGAWLSQPPCSRPTNAEPAEMGEYYCPWEHEVACSAWNQEDPLEIEIYRNGEFRAVSARPRQGELATPIYSVLAFSERTHEHLYDYEFVTDGTPALHTRRINLTTGEVKRDRGKCLERRVRNGPLIAPEPERDNT